MEKRYQVFVSSTYDDLQEERQEVMHALLELECIPSGMELFPAANEDQWTVIKRVIDDCDYYIVIVGGRYGSVDKDGMSYTEKEYRYALEKGKPVIGFLHKSPGDLPAKKTEQLEDKKQRLGAFRELVGQKLCQFWDSPADLGSKVSRSLIKLIKQHPAVGWVRADQVPSEDVNQELLLLRKKIDELQRELAAASTKAPSGSKELAQGDDEFTVFFSFNTTVGPFPDEGEKHRAKCTLTWNDIFYVISPCMIEEAPQYQLPRILSRYIEQKTRSGLQSQFKGADLSDFNIETDFFDTILVQLKALGLITKSGRAKSVKDTGTYWKLTPYGETIMTQLRAIRKKAPKANKQVDSTV